MRLRRMKIEHRIEYRFYLFDVTQYASIEQSAPPLPLLICPLPTTHPLPLHALSPWHPSPPHPSPLQHSRPPLHPPPPFIPLPRGPPPPPLQQAPPPPLPPSQSKSSREKRESVAARGLCVGATAPPGASPAFICRVPHGITHLVRRPPPHPLHPRPRHRHRGRHRRRRHSPS